MADGGSLEFQLNYLKFSKVTSTGKIIGRGAYGRAIEVYVNKTLCAAKEIHPLLVENASSQELEAMIKSFNEECSKASRIHHPNVVQVLGIYYPTPQAKLPWLVMEMMEMSLRSFLEKHEQGKVPLHFKLSILVDVAQGLEFLHGQGIVHRDLSSNNILLTKNLVAKIADLGMAKVIQESKSTLTQAPGAKDYMPPEALKKNPHYGKPVDIFSLACVTLHVMSHRWPEPKDRVSEDTLTVLTEMRRREDYINFCTQPALRKLVESCLNNTPEKRPDISVVCVKLKELKVTIENQVPFSTSSIFELFDVVQQKIQENNHLQQMKDQQIQEKDQQTQERNPQIQEKDQLIQEKDRQMQEKDQLIRKQREQIQKCDQEKNEQIKQKNQQIQQMVKQMQQKDMQIQQKNQQIQQKNQQIQQKDQQIQLMVDQMQWKNEQIQQRDQKIEALSNKVVCG